MTLFNQIDPRCLQFSHNLWWISLWPWKLQKRYGWTPNMATYKPEFLVDSASYSKVHPWPFNWVYAHSTQSSHNFGAYTETSSLRRFVSSCHCNYSLTAELPFFVTFFYISDEEHQILWFTKFSLRNSMMQHSEKAWCNLWKTFHFSVFLYWNLYYYPSTLPSSSALVLKVISQ